jgi:hypothetical protein
MEVDGGSALGQNMHGDTTITIRYTDQGAGGTFTAVIPNGTQVSAPVVVPFNGPALTINAGQLFNTTYTAAAQATTGSQFDNHNVVTSDTENIYWDRNEEHPEIVITNLTYSSTTATFTWIPIAVNATNNGEFYEYRVYYREVGPPVGPWIQFGGEPLEDPNLRYPNNVGTTTISNLVAFRDYECYMVAVDIFGNEIPTPGVLSTFQTTPLSTEVAISDGITRYEDSSFVASTTPSDRQLRSTNIRVDMELQTGSDIPETVRVWYVPGDIAVGGDIVVANAIDTGLANLYSSVAQKTGANTWVAHLSTDSGLFTTGANIRFIIETVFQGTSTFLDSDSTNIASPGPNDREYTFQINTPVKLTPHPVRILNNVITKKKPVAYPAYYLTSDAYVTIRVYDIKGRPVATLLENSFRRGGYNIKEQGWRGTNKVGRKLGIGLYYIRIKAKRASDGRTILNKVKKVVVAR